MSVVKKYNPNTEQWEAILPGTTGPTGPQGETGPVGPQGETGPAGPTGQGVPTGGATHAVLAKSSATDYATEWADRPWNTAWGVLDHSEIASSQTISSTSNVDVTGLEVTWDAVADRRYRLHAHVPVGHVSGAATNAVVLIADSSNATANFMFLGLSSATANVRKAADVYWFWEPATTTSATYKVQARTTVSSTSWNVVLGFGSKAYFYVEDVGPA